MDNTKIINKSKGLTKTEKFLADLCEKSFLKLWSYPNTYNEKRQEICDLLVVFENDIFVFFDREVTLDALEDNSKFVIKWERWKRNVIDNQIDTARGAERYIKSGRKIFLEKNLTTEMPIQYNSETVVIHKIIVANGAENACKDFSEQNMNGSLAISYSDDTDKPTPPFALRLPRNEIIHVFDTYNLPLILNELSTIFDFKSYLKAKEEAIKRYTQLTYCGEEDLLAIYFLNFDELKQEHFIGTNEQGIAGLFVGEGAWNEFCSNEQYQERKRLDNKYLFWDNLIQDISNDILNGTAKGGNFYGNNAMLEMAKEPRFVRRTISKLLVDKINSFPYREDGVSREAIMINSFFPEKAYVFLQVHRNCKKITCN